MARIHGVLGGAGKTGPGVCQTHGVRREELDRLGIHLPVLATMALGYLPGPPAWAPRLLSAGVDVVASGADADSVDTWRAAREAVPFRPVKARPGDADALVAAGAVLLETDAHVPPGVYAVGPGEAVVALIDGTSADVEDPNVVARDIVDIARERVPSALWVVSSPGMHELPVDVAEAKLASLAECAYRARLVFAKEQFDLD